MTDPLPFPQPPRFAPMPDDPGVGERDVTPSLLDMARAISAICATRILLLLAVLISAPIWVWTIYDPSPLRIAAATANALVSVLPLVYLYLRRG